MSGNLPTQHTDTGQHSNMSDFGLMYYNARYYDPALGRFTSADTLIPEPGNPQSWDRYAYVENNPLRYTDPSGHMQSCGMEGCGIVPPLIIPRSQWGQYAPGENPGNFSEAERETYDPNDEFGGYYEYREDLKDELDTIVLHHVGDGGLSDNPQAIENAHMVALGYYDVGYHFIIGTDGKIYEGRNIRARGYHVRGFNSHKIGIVLMGDFSTGYPTKQ